MEWLVLIPVVMENFQIFVKWKAPQIIINALCSHNIVSNRMRNALPLLRQKDSGIWKSKFWPSHVGVSSIALKVQAIHGEYCSNFL